MTEKIPSSLKQGLQLCRRGIHSSQYVGDFNSIILKYVTREVVPQCVAHPRHDDIERRAQVDFIGNDEINDFDVLFEFGSPIKKPRFTGLLFLFDSLLQGVFEYFQQVFCVAQAMRGIDPGVIGDSSNFTYLAGEHPKWLVGSSACRFRVVDQFLPAFIRCSGWDGNCAGWLQRFFAWEVHDRMETVLVS